MVQKLHYFKRKTGSKCAKSIKGGVKINGGGPPNFAKSINGPPSFIRDLTVWGDASSYPHVSDTLANNRR